MHDAADKSLLSRAALECLQAQVTRMLPEEALEAPNVARWHVKEDDERLVAAARPLEAAPDNPLEIFSGEIARHERMLNRRPEGFSRCRP